MIENYKKELSNFIKSNCSEGYWYDFVDLNAFPTAKELWEGVNNGTVDEQEALDAFNEVADELMTSKYENDQYVYQLVY